MNPDTETKIRNHMADLGVNYQWLPIDHNMADTTEFCAHYGYEINQSGNTIIVASKRGTKKYSACLVLASTRLDVNKKVKSLMEVSRLSFASSVETQNITGMQIGGVTPFGLPDNINIYVDNKIFDIEQLVVGAGVRSAKIIINPLELQKIPNLEIVQELAFS